MKRIFENIYYWIYEKIFVLKDFWKRIKHFFKNHIWLLTIIIFLLFIVFLFFWYVYLKNNFYFNIHIENISNAQLYAFKKCRIAWYNIELLDKQGWNKIKELYNDCIVSIAEHKYKKTPILFKKEYKISQCQIPWFCFKLKWVLKIKKQINWHIRKYKTSFLRFFKALNPLKTPSIWWTIINYND